MFKDSETINPPDLVFVSVETVCRHCHGDGHSRYGPGDCGGCNGAGTLKVVRLRQVMEATDHGKSEDQN